MATVTLTRADTVIALRNAWEDAREIVARGDTVSAYRWGLLLRYAYNQIRSAKARAAWKAAEAAREAALAKEAAFAAAVRAKRIDTFMRGRWEGPVWLLDQHHVTQLEVWRYEMADSFTSWGNDRLFAAKARLAEIEAQLVWRTVA